MLKKILYYGKENNKKTVRSIIVLFLSVIFQIAPFLFIYFIIGKILNHQTVTSLDKGTQPFVVCDG